MVGVRERFELHVALHRAIDAEAATATLEMLGDIARRPDWQQYNRDRFRAEPDRSYRLYESLDRVVGPNAAATWMALLDPLGWRELADTSALVGHVEGGDHGC
jgi:hypothetical protein